MSDIHGFNVNVACDYGVNAAIVLNGLHHWCVVNRANNRNLHDGNWWTYNSVRAMKTLFPYLTENQIHKALKDLERNGLIVSGNYNKSSYDRTKWYALTDYGYSYYGEGIMSDGINHFDSNQNGVCLEHEPIPVEETIKEPIKKTRGRFTPPTREEVAEYTQEKGYTSFPVDRFMAYYESNGWMVGRSKMKDWKASVRYWESGEKGKANEIVSEYADLF